MPIESRVKRILRVIAALAMLAIGTTHFTAPEGFVKIVPAFLPAPLVLVYVSGFFEILGGLGLLLARVHRAAAYGLIALYIAVFPANINMAVHDIQPAASHIPESALWIRLPFQLVFIGLAWWALPVSAMRAICRPLLLLNVLYCLLAAAQEGLPGWHMFESVEPIDHELRDRDGQVIDVRSVLPKNANLVDRTELRSIVAWICEHEPARAPFTYREQPRDHKRLPFQVQLEPVGRDGCKIHAPR